MHILTPTATTTSAYRPPQRGSVAWSTVLSLGMVLSYADGFWVTSMRGAVGAVGRGQAPFETWWRESAVMTPVYVCAMVGSLWLALLGHRKNRRSTLSGVVLLVVATATAVGVVEMAAGAVHDFLAQSGQIQMMSLMRGGCRPDCIARLQSDSLWLQVRAVLLGAGLLLVSNVAVVAWVTMIRGGRLPISTPTHPHRAGVGHPTRTEWWRAGAVRTGAGKTETRRLLAAGLLGAAAIHVAVVPEHLHEWWAAAAFFVALAVAQVGGAVSVLLRNSPLVLLTAGLTSLVPILVWAWSRFVGLPFGPDPGTPEAVGTPDIACLALEMLTLLLASRLRVGGPGGTRRTGTSDHARWLALTAVLAVTVVGVAASQPGWFDVVPPSTMG